MSPVPDILLLAETDNPLQAPVLSACYDYWLTLKENAPMPPRDGFKPRDLVEYLPLISLIDVIEGGADFRYRLVGTCIDEVIGHHYTGLLLSEIANKKSRATRRETYQRCVEEKRTVYTAGSLSNYNKDYRFYQTLLMPFSDDGKSVNILFAAHDSR